MDDITFAHQVLAWLDPLEVLQCGRRLRDDRRAALSAGTLVVVSGVLADGSEARFDVLVQKFLRGFRMPLGMLELLAVSDFDFPFTEADLRWVADLQLTPQVDICNRSNPSRGLPLSTILLIHERDTVLDLIRNPVLGLLDLVTRFAWTWRDVKEMGIAAFHQPSVPSPFFCYVEQQVAASYVELQPPPHVVGTSGPNTRYRAVTVYGPSVEDVRHWDVIREVARMQAKSTWEPLPEKDR